MPRTSKASSASGSGKTSQTPNRYAGMSRSNSGDRATIAACAPSSLAAAVDTVLDAGDLISFSRTGDGGALVVYVKHAGGENRSYCVHQQELDQVLEYLRDA